jgi:hypothetical protein
MSFLQRVVSQARALVPDIPVARPKGLLLGPLSAAGPPVQEAMPSAPAPMREEFRPAPSPVLDAAPERTGQQPAVPMATPSPAEISVQTDFGADTPPVVEWRVPPPAPAEELGSPADPTRAMPPDARLPELHVLAADAAPASDASDPEPASRPGFEVVEPRHAPQAELLPGPALAGPAEPPGSPTQAPDAVRATPDEPTTSDRRDGTFRAEPPPQAADRAPILEPEGAISADRPIEEDHGRPVEVLPIARPLSPSPMPLPPAERALPARPAAEARRPVLQIDQIDVLVTDPAPVPAAAARSPFTAVAASRRYLRRL